MKTSKSTNLVKTAVTALIICVAVASDQKADQRLLPLTNNRPMVVTNCPGTWQTRASGSIARRLPAVAQVNGILYAAGGALPNSTSSTNAFEAYDPVNNTWSVKPSMPVATQQAAAAELNGLFYAVGGGTCCGPLPTLQVYNPATNSWMIKASMPTARFAPAAAAVDGILYVAGGGSGFGTIYATLEAYDPVSDTWSTKAPMPEGRRGLGLVAVNGVLYAIGGDHDSGFTATVAAYDPISNSWTTKAPMPTPRTFLAVSAVDGIIYAIGGNTNTQTVTTVEAYDPVANTWTTSTPMPVLQDVEGAGAINGTIYVARCTHPSYPDTSVLTIEAFTPNCAPSPLSAASRKVHGGAGTFDIDLPLSDNVGIECRSGGATNDYQMIINFATSVTVGSASVTFGTGSVSSFSVSGPQVTVNLTGVTNVQRITVTLMNVNDGTHRGNVLVFMGVLVGDVNGNAVVNASDVSLTKSQVGNPVTSSNFREDVNANGTISATDVALVKSKVGTALPP
jgi:hypothetical protein